MRRGGTAAETNVAEKKGKKTIKLLASSSEQISPAAMIFRRCLTFSPLPACPVCLFEFPPEFLWSESNDTKCFLVEINSSLSLPTAACPGEGKHLLTLHLLLLLLAPGRGSHLKEHL